MIFAKAQSMFKKMIAFLSHPAWNGASCFVTAFLALGLGGAVVAFGLGLFHRLQDLISWLLAPATTPRYIIIVAALVLLAFLIAAARQLFASSNWVLRAAKSKATVDQVKSFVPIALFPGIGNARMQDRYIAPPSGQVLLGGVEFEFDKNSLIFDTNAHIREYVPIDGDGKRVELRLPRPVNGIVAAHFLLNSGNSKLIYSRCGIGQIGLYFREAPPIEIDLVLGYNVREWCPGNSGDYIREASSSSGLHNVWTGMNKGGANAVIDCLTIPIYDIMKLSFLEKIVLSHTLVPKPPDTIGVHYSVFGISLEIGSTQ